MKFDTVNRLRHLGAIRDAKSAAARDASDRATDIRNRLRRAEARKNQLEREFHPREVKESLAKIDREIETLRAELNDAEHRRAEAGAASQAAGAVYKAARDFAAEHRLPMRSDDAAEVRGVNWPHAGTGGV